MKAEVPLDAVLGHARLTVQQIAQLQVGDIVQLDSSPFEPIDVEVGGVRRYEAVRGRRGEQSAIQLAAILRE